MDAMFKKLQVTPAKYGKEGGIERQEFATLTVEIPMDSAQQTEAVKELLPLLSHEYIHVDVYNVRKPADAKTDSIKVTHESPTGKVQTASMTQDDMQSQLKTLGEA